MRTERLAAGIAPNSVNREHAYLRSVFNELRRLGQWKNRHAAMIAKVCLASGARWSEAQPAWSM
ncbi:MAG: hypothetical protein IT506_02565 [Aquabacterium sp.]|jgi:hypothetical protein|nr:hypothetical protein [Aquabacterium sp.]